MGGVDVEACVDGRVSGMGWMSGRRRCCRCRCRCWAVARGAMTMMCSGEVKGRKARAVVEGPAAAEATRQQRAGVSGICR